MTSRVLGVDYGKSRVGLAVTDVLGKMAQPLEVVTRTPRTSLVAQVSERALGLNVTLIVVGLPLHLDGSEGPSAEAARAFADALAARTGITVEMHDERLTSVEASRILDVGGVSGRRQKGTVDKIAAALLLQAYLDSHRDLSVDIEDVRLPESALRTERPPSRVREDPQGATHGIDRRKTDAARRVAWRRDVDDA